MAVEPLLARCDGVDGARAASGSMKGRAKMVVARATEGAPSMGKFITDLSSVTTVWAWIWPSTSFKFTAS